MIATFLDPIYYLNFIYFIIAALLTFYIPGNVLLRKFKFDFLASFVFSIGLGIVLWAYQGFIFGFLGLRELSYVYIAIFTFIWFKFNLVKTRPKFPKINLSINDLPIFILLFLGIIVQMSFTFLMGISLDKGIYFCCGLPDSLYHIGLTNSLVNYFPPYEPAMYGAIIKNYHYLANLVEADLIRIFHLPVVFTQYQYMTLLITSLLGLSVIVIGKILKLGRVFTFLALLFLFFWGDITYLFTFIVGKGIDFRIPFLYDSTALWFSPPRAFGTFITFIGIGLIILWFKKNTFYLSFLLALVFGSLVGFKIYSGIFVLIGLFFLSLYPLYKKDYKRLLLPFLTLIISLVIYLPVNDQASGLYFVGFWRIENFIVQPGFGLSHLELAKKVYADHGNILRIIEYEGIYALSYVVFVFGALNLAWFQSRKSLKLFPKELNVFLISSILASLIIGFFFFQKVAGSNTSQFIITAEIIGILYAALAGNIIMRKLGKFKFVFLGLIILLSVPRVIDLTISNFHTQLGKGGYLVDSSEVEALNYLKNNTKSSSVILADLKKLKTEKSCYYISFMSNRNLFICDANGILRDHGVEVDKKYNDYKIIVRDLTSPRSKRLLVDNKVDYVYTVSGLYAFGKDERTFKIVFVNDKITIIKVNR